MPDAVSGLSEVWVTVLVPDNDEFPFIGAWESKEDACAYVRDIAPHEDGWRNRIVAVCKVTPAKVGA